MFPFGREEGVELCPGTGSVWGSDDDAAIDEPVLKIEPPPFYGRLEAIDLDIDRGGEDEGARGDVLILLHALEQAILIDLDRLFLLEGLTQPLVETFEEEKSIEIDED